MKEKGAKIVIDTLIEQGVDTVFAYPGGSVLDIFDALYSASGKIKAVLPSHEQGGTHAADGYARATGKTGVMIATSGPGATNTVTGIATAYMDSVPMVIITGNVSMPLLGRDSFQEIDIAGVTMPITKHNYIVKDIKDLADTIREAFVIAKSGRPGPVLVDIPKNIQQSEYEFISKTPKIVKPKPVAPEKVITAAEYINDAKRPLIYAGGGVISSGATAELIAFAEKIDAPVALSMMGLGAFPASHPLYTGMIGMHGLAGVAFSVAECDTLIVLGARFSDRVATDRLKFAKHARIVHIDIDNAEIDKNVTSHAHILGDVKETLKTLIPVINKSNHSEWVNYVKEMIKSRVAKEQDTALSPREILRTINRLSPDDQIIATDVGLHQMWTAQSYNFEKPRTLITSGGLGTMGFGLGAAIGACIGTGRQTILITGDGSFQMNLNELVTASKGNIPVAVFLFNNSTLGMVRQWQKLFYGRRYSSTNLNSIPTDYEKLAAAFGIKGITLDKNEDIEKVVKEVLATKGPVLINCKIDIDYGVFPMIPAGKTEADIIMEELKEGN